MTGDNSSSANAVAENVGITNVIANVKPDEKAAQVERLQQDGRKVIMIGDGINDAAALSIADVGIAMGAGSDIAPDAADFALIRDDLIDAVSSVELAMRQCAESEQTLHGLFPTTRSEYLFAMGLLPCHLLGSCYPPPRRSSNGTLFISVVTNSIILRWWQPVSL